MRKKLVGLVAVGLLLSGCSSSEAAGPAPTPTPNPNVRACAAFATAFSAGISPAPQDLKEWEQTRNKVDEISLLAEGDTKERMQALVSDWPEMGDIFLWNDLDAANRLLGDIERACAVEGHEISVQLATVD